MNRTSLIFLVNWYVVISAASCFALWAFFINKSGLRWPLPPAVFCFTQGLISLPVLVYHWRKIRGYEGDLPAAIVAAVASLIILYVMYFLGKNLTPKLHMNWAYLAALLGLTGLYLFTHELARLGELKETGQKVIGLTIASTVAIESIIMVLYHYWDIRKTEERISLVNVLGIFFIVCGIFCLFKRKHPAMQSAAQSQEQGVGEAMEVAQESMVH